MEVLRRAGVTQGEVDHWSKWLLAAEEISARFEAWEDDPFAYNEQASVGILTAAAFQAGLVALPEYIAQKASKADRRKRVDGRCDLWLGATRSDWAFEFKNMIVGVAPRAATLAKRLQQAVDCVKHVTATEAAKRVGCLMVSTYPALETKVRLELRERLSEFAQAVDFAALIESKNSHARPTFFFMRHYR